jgi:hypothetical protein
MELFNHGWAGADTDKNPNFAGGAPMSRLV